MSAAICYFRSRRTVCASFRSARALARANAHSERSRDPTKRLVRGTAVYRLPFGTCGPRVFASDGAQKLRSQDTGTGGRKDDPKVHWPTSWPLKFCLTCMLVVLTLCSSVRDTDMGETRTRRRTHQRDDLAPKICVLRGRLDAASSPARNSRGFAVSRAECSAGMDWRSGLHPLGETAKQRTVG